MALRMDLAWELVIISLGAILSWQSPVDLKLLKDSERQRQCKRELHKGARLDNIQVLGQKNDRAMHN